MFFHRSFLTPSLFYKNKYVTDFIQKVEHFNSLFVKQSFLMIENDSKLQSSVKDLTVKRLASVKLSSGDILTL